VYYYLILSDIKTIKINVKKMKNIFCKNDILRKMENKDSIKLHAIVLKMKSLFIFLQFPIFLHITFKEINYVF